MLKHMNGSTTRIHCAALVSQAVRACARHMMQASELGIDVWPKPPINELKCTICICMNECNGAFVCASVRDGLVVQFCMLGGGVQPLSVTMGCYQG